MSRRASGCPSVPLPPLAPRRATQRTVVLRHPHHPVDVGGDAPVSVQSMTTTLTADVNATLQQIAELTASGCQVVRVAVPSQDDADALPAIARKSDIPVIADIHFQPKYVFAAIDAGLRGRAGEPGQHQAVRRQGRRDREGRRRRRRADPDRRQRRLARPAAAGEVRQGDAGGAGRVGAVGVLAVRGARLPRHQDLGQAPRPGRDGAGLPAARRPRATTRCTSASPRPGPTFQGTIKSAVAFGALLAEGIGDTIRVSLSAPPVEEVKVGLRSWSR